MVVLTRSFSSSTSMIKTSHKLGVVLTLAKLECFSDSAFSDLFQIFFQM